MTHKRIHSLLVATAAFVIISMSYLFYLGYRLSVEHAPLVDAAMEIKLEATTAHLWFEEIMSGDDSLSIESVWEHIEKAEWYANAMLSGGQNSEGKFYPLKDEIARNSILSVKKQLARFRDIAKERFNEKKSSKPGSNIDQRFDAIFNDFISQSDDAETKVQHIIEIQQTRFYFLGIILLFSSLITATIMMRIVVRNNKSKTELLESLNNTNIKLHASEKLLEQKVLERTLDLEIANNTLTAQKIAMDEHSIVAITDVKGTITYVNDKFCEISGYTRRELVGHNHRLLNSGSQPESYWQTMYKTVANGSPWHDVIRNKAKDGHYYWVDTTIAPIIGEKGKPKNYIAIRTDVTKQKLMQAELENYSLDLEKQVNERTKELVLAKENAELANEEKSRFLANMSHELRTPMHAIMSFAKLAHNKTDEKKTASYMEKIITSGDRLTGLLNNLLDLSKLEAGRMTLSATEHDMALIIKECLSEIEILIEQKKLSIIFESKQTLADFDKSLIHQVIINLLSNAVKYSPQEGKIKILLITDEKMLRGVTQEVLQCSIKDQGIGIPPSELDIVFDKFSQSSITDTKAGGTGLGLAICHEIIAMHKGVMWAESPIYDEDLDTEEMQIGTAFHFKIPRYLNSSDN